MRDFLYYHNILKWFGYFLTIIIVTIQEVVHIYWLPVWFVLNSNFSRISPILWRNQIIYIEINFRLYIERGRAMKCYVCGKSDGYL